jgi:hypothetical protein
MCSYGTRCVRKMYVIMWYRACELVVYMSPKIDDVTHLLQHQEAPVMLVQSMHDRATPQRKNIVHARRGHHLRPGPGSSTFVTASRGPGPEYSTREEGGRTRFCSDALYGGVRYGSKYNPPNCSGPATAHNSTRDEGAGFKGP